MDPNAPGRLEDGIYGIPSSREQAKLVYIPVPWDVTTSYGKGTDQGPGAILRASVQMDLYDPDVIRPYEEGLFLLPHSAELAECNERGKAAADQNHFQTVNKLCEQMNDFVYREARSLFQSGKIVAVIGGDHSSPLGAIQAVAERHAEFGILHIDAHADLRNAYQGFTYSHASIMYNVSQRIGEVKKITQVGIRDFCEEEFSYIKNQKGRIETFFDSDLARARFEGETFQKTASKIIETLPEKVWISFDIDGLDPRFCPNTGTPVPGGLDFNEAVYLIASVARSGRKIIGFDLCEVSPGESGEWDANVGMRILYKLSAWTLASQGLVSWT